MEKKLSNGQIITDVMLHNIPKSDMLNDISRYDKEKMSIPLNNENGLVTHTGFINSHLCIFIVETKMDGNNYPCDYSKDPFKILDINSSLEQTREFLYFFGSPRMPYMDIIYKGAYVMFDFLKKLNKNLGKKVQQDIDILMDKITDALNLSDDS